MPVKLKVFLKIKGLSKGLRFKNEDTDGGKLW